MNVAIEPHAIVIGAGVGGLPAALRLRAEHCRVTVIDRCGAIGGRAQEFERDGFRDDAGPTLVRFLSDRARRGIYLALVRALPISPFLRQLGRSLVPLT